MRLGKKMCIELYRSRSRDAADKHMNAQPRMMQIMSETHKDGQ
jgi:hypothetical protein